MPRHTDATAQAAWDDLIKLIKLIPEDELSFIREKVITESLRYGAAMYRWGTLVGWNTGFDAGQGVDE